MGLLSDLSDRLTTAINNAAIDGTLRKEQLQRMKERVDQDVTLFSSAYETVVNKGTDQAVTVILDRNGELMALSNVLAPPSGDHSTIIEALRGSANKPGGIYSVAEKQQLLQDVIMPLVNKQRVPAADESMVFFNGQRVKGQFVNTDPTLIWGYPVDENFKVAVVKTQSLVSTGNMDKDSIGYRLLGEVPPEDVFMAKTVLGRLHDEVLADVLQTRGKDGLVLSDRIWRLTEESKRDITNRLTKGILLGESHTKVAKDIRQYVNGTGGMRYKSERLVLTEFSRAYQVANEQAVNIMRASTEYKWFQKWELSPAHPKVDVCDVLASQDTIGEGPGVYKEAPTRHPGCYCYIYPVYRQAKTSIDYPNISPVRPKGDEATQADKLLANKLL